MDGQLSWFLLSRYHFFLKKKFWKLKKHSKFFFKNFKNISMFLKNAFMFYQNLCTFSNSIKKAEKIKKVRKKPSQVSPSHNCLIYRVPVWNLGTFTKFHRFHTSTDVKLGEPFLKLEGSHGNIVNQLFKHRWNLWRLFTSFFWLLFESKRKT